MKGSDAADTGTGPILNAGDTPDNSPAPSVAGSEYDLDESPAAIPSELLSTEQPPGSPSTAIPPIPSVPKPRGHYQESMSAMLTHIKAFIKVRSVDQKFRGYVFKYNVHTVPGNVP